MILRLASDSVSRRLGDFCELTKPRLSGLVLFTTAVGCWLGMRSAAQAPLFLSTMIGTALVVAGANALNQWAERDQDRLMLRTRHRPVPTGRLHPDSAHRFGAALVLAGVVYLALAANLLAAGLAVVSAVSYLALYTPMKSASALCTLVGAIPGALPPVIGWAAMRGTLGPEAWALFAILFIWQLPHFLGIALLYRDDYARAGFCMLPLTEPHGFVTARQIVLYGLVLVPASLFPSFLGLAGACYGIGALLLSAAFLAIGVRAALVRSTVCARHLFLASVAYLPLLLLLLACDKRCA